MKGSKEKEKYDDNENDEKNYLEKDIKDSKENEERFRKKKKEK